MQGVFPFKQRLLFGKKFFRWCIAQSDEEVVKQEVCVGDLFPGPAAGQSDMQYSVHTVMNCC